LVEKKTQLTLKEKKSLIEPENSFISIAGQCELLGLPRSSYYYEPSHESEYNLALMRKMDEIHLLYPFYGYRRMWASLVRKGEKVSQNRIHRLWKLMGYEATYPKPDLSKADVTAGKYPYLLRNLAVYHPDQVWSCDITYIPMQSGFLYLMALIDWHSRYVLGWSLSNSMEADFCINCLKTCLEEGILKNKKPLIFNTDQGSQFTGHGFTGVLKEHHIAISQDGKGRATDNAFIERLWRSVKYEYVFLHDIKNGKVLYEGLETYFTNERPHQGIDYRIPAEVYFEEG
jgi:putative transposase